ncbi:hypothetical protein ACFPPA_15485 [Rhodanobacter ginsengisoli]|uniref:Uncharacterized protein n=1 Tax=Rhodanobacter ginsengisoli TaxID=418646 RepID=A0ABW0QU99_9GAMM
MWKTLLPMLAWIVLLAVLPWWLGLPLLLASAATLWLVPHRLAPEHVMLIRRGLHWGLPGLAFALQRTLGGDAFAWGAALLAVLAGYTLLAGLEAWLDRHQRRTPAAASAEWPELALAPTGPTAEIIELQPPGWQSASEDIADPHGGHVTCREDGCHFADGHRVDGVGTPPGFAQVGFSPGGRWFAARMADDSVLTLWDRQHDRQHRLRGWQLCGWYREQPWLIRRNGDMPLALPAVLGRDDD